jgi:molecular chaperone DnaK (HSP70)
LLGGVQLPGDAKAEVYLPAVDVGREVFGAVGECDAAVSAGMKKIMHGGKSKVPAAIRQEISKTRLLEVCNKNFGTLAIFYDETLEKHKLRNTIILEKNTAIPCSKTESFYTIQEGQKQVKVRITECEETEYDEDHVKYIGELMIDLPPNTPRESLVKVSYSYDENQRLHCSVQIPGGAIYETDIGYDGQGNLKQSEIRQKAAALDSFIVE